MREAPASALGLFLRTIRFHAVVLAAAWTAVVAAALAWNLVQQSRVVVETARVIARTGFEKGVLYRRWNAGHGGVYVRVTEGTPPNPYLAGIAARDHVSTDGTAFTLVNPAYMSRQVFELQKASTGILGHITSLRPIRPANAPDPWERSALEAFDRGSPEVSSVELFRGEPHLRLMRPLSVEDGCLRCHARQGCRAGEVRGGISESIPLAPLRKAAQGQTWALLLGHGSIWLLGLAGIRLAGWRLHGSMQRQEEAEAALLHASTHDALTGLGNRTFFEEAVRRLEERNVRPVSVLLLNVDGLKPVNDRDGHAAGDELLRRAAQVIQATFRAHDLVARTGGDEFVILLPSTNAEQTSLAEALRHADAAMYEEKARRKVARA